MLAISTKFEQYLTLKRTTTNNNSVHHNTQYTTRHIQVAMVTGDRGHHWTLLPAQGFLISKYMHH